MDNTPDCFRDMRERQQKADIDYKNITKGMPFTINLGGGEKMTLNKKPDPIEGTMAQMPKAKIEESGWPTDDQHREEWIAGQAQGIAHQCRLLAKEGWRKAPSEEEIERMLNEIEQKGPGHYSIMAKKLRAKWLMGEKE